MKLEDAVGEIVSIEALAAQIKDGMVVALPISGRKYQIFPSRPGGTVIVFSPWLS